MSSTYTPPTTANETQTEQPQEEMRDCPVCSGIGQIPASMGRDEMIDAINQNMPNAEEPERGESQEQTTTPLNTRFPELSDDQRSEVNRLKGHATEYMKKRNFGY